MNFKNYIKKHYEDFNSNTNLLLKINELESTTNSIIAKMSAISREILDENKKEDILYKAEWLSDWKKQFLNKTFSDFKNSYLLTYNNDVASEVVQGYIELLDLIINDNNDIYGKYNELFRTIREMPYNIKDCFMQLKIAPEPMKHSDAIVKSYNNDNIIYVKVAS